MDIEIRLRRNLSSEWIRHDPILGPGEPGFEIDTGKLKIGDGLKRWTGLDYVAPVQDDFVALQIDLNNHKIDPNPHPAYDDGSSFLDIYLTAKE